MNVREVPADIALGSIAVLVRAVTLSLAFVLFCGCGNAPHDPAIGFVNQTEHSDARLWDLWHAAQRSIAQNIDLNPLQQQTQSATPHVLPGDSRALGVSPRQLVVTPQPDVLAATLYVETGAVRSDPTGLVQCPQPCNVDYAPAYSLYTRPTTRYAASWEFQGNNFDQLVEYEFENQILHVLGYDLRWR